MVDFAKLIMERNHEVLLNNQHAHGYTLLTVTRDAVIGELVSVEKLAKPYSASALARYRVSPAEGPGIGPIQPVGPATTDAIDNHSQVGQIRP
jgi:hypothetical protein